MRRGATAAHAGWTAADGRRSRREGGGQVALVERRAAERGALRARLRRASIVGVREDVGVGVGAGA